MSDTGTPSAPASAPSAPAPAAPSRTEVPVNPNPVNVPSPIGSQAPPKSVGDLKGSEHHPVSRREAARESIRKAFAANDRKIEPGPAKAGMGHNQPPEPMRREPINLRKRPTDDQASGSGGTSGGTRTNTSNATSATEARRGSQPGWRPTQSGTQAAPPTQKIRLPENAPYRNAPKRWDQRARAEWGAAPESVRASVYRMGHDFQRAFAQTRAELELHNTVRHYHQMAQQHGTTLQRALDNYTTMENKLRTDPIGGLDVIVHNLNLRTPQGQRIGLRDIAYHVLNTTPEGHQALQMRNEQSALAQQIQQLQQHNAALAQQLQYMQYRQEFARTRRGVDRFAESHPRLDELGDLIERELKLGFNLKEAYRRAELLRPAGSQPVTQAAQTRNAPAQTRNRSASRSDRSIHGAPDSGSMSNGRWSGQRPDNLRGIIARNIRQVSGSL
jgi:hypothetical protein